MHREYHRWHSPSLGREMELLWYGRSGRPVLAFPTSLGSCSQNEDNGLIGALADKIGGGEIQVCCVDAIDSECWYNDSAHPGWKAFRYSQCDQYLVGEVVPLIRQKAQREDVVTFGASFGGYHAVNFAGRHPELVSRVISFSVNAVDPREDLLLGDLRHSPLPARLLGRQLLFQLPRRLLPEPAAGRGRSHAAHRLGDRHRRERPPREREPLVRRDAQGQGVERAFGVLGRRLRPRLAILARALETIRTVGFTSRGGFLP
jgi:esterase/lipase superfamily enzyme